MPSPSPPYTVAVIGAGVVGLSCAIHLLRGGHKVELFDPREPGHGASFGNAGIVAVSEVLPIGRPAILRQVPRMLLDAGGPLVIRWRYMPRIAPWLLRLVAASRPAEIERIATALAALLAPAVDEWRGIVRGTAGEALLSAQGWLRVYPQARDLQAAMPDVARLRALGVRVEILDAGAVRDLEPALAPAFAGGVFYPDAANVLSPGRMMRALAAEAQRLGGAFHRREISRIEVSDERPRLVDTEGAAEACDRVVIAAGAWSRGLLRSLGVDLPLDTERGYHAMLPTPARSLQRPVSVANPGYTLAQMTDGIRLTSGVEFAGLAAPADFRRVRRMAVHAAGILPGLSTEADSEWLGFRPSLPRSLPAIGPLRRHPPVVLAFGHGHVGLTLGPMTGRLVAAIIDGRAPPIDVTPFLPEV